MLVLLLVVVLIILSVMFGGFQKGTKSGGLGPVGPSALTRLSTEHHAPLLSRRPLSWTATRGKQGVSIHDRGIPGSGPAARGMRERTLVTLATLAPDRKAWMPRSRRWSAVPFSSF